MGLDMRGFLPNHCLVRLFGTLWISHSQALLALLHQDRHPRGALSPSADPFKLLELRISLFSVTRSPKRLGESVAYVGRIGLQPRRFLQVSNRFFALAPTRKHGS